MTSLAILLAVACAPDSGRALDFPSEPPYEWVAKGRDWGKSPTASWRCAASFQRTIGYRNAGPFRQSMEFAWWFSPGYVASRMGYLSRREYWPEGELERRWNLIASAMREKLVFLVQLGASPQLDLLTGDQSGRARLDDLDPVRFVLKTADQVHEPEAAALVWKQRSRQFGVFTGFPWYQFAPGAEFLIGEFESTVDAKAVAFGDHHLALYRVEFSTQKLNRNSETMELVVISKNKERVAKFSL